MAYQQVLRRNSPWHPPLVWTACSTSPGTITGYRKHMERRVGWHPPLVWEEVCCECRDAVRVRAQRYRVRRIVNGGREVRRENNPRLRKIVGGEVLIDATGTKRRLHALGALGWSWRLLGAKIGMSGPAIGYLALHRGVVYPETKEKIKALYDEMSMLPAVNVVGHDKIGRNKRMARKKGWLPPLAWEDEMIDDPYALPAGVDRELLWYWYCNNASDHERIEWVLENGIPRQPPLSKPYKRVRSKKKK